MYDQLKVNGIKCKIALKYGSASTEPSYPSTGVFTYVAVDRNGISDPPTAMKYEKIATYSSAKAKMLTPGSSVS